MTKQYDLYSYEQRMTICAAVQAVVANEDPLHPLSDARIGVIVTDQTGIFLGSQKAIYYRKRLGLVASQARRAAYMETKSASQTPTI